MAEFFIISIIVIAVAGAAFKLFIGYQVEKAASAFVEVGADVAKGFARTRRQCPHCKSIIHFEATTCPKCSLSVEPAQTCPACGAVASWMDTECLSCKKVLPRQEKPTAQE